MLSLQYESVTETLTNVTLFEDIDTQATGSHELECSLSGSCDYDDG